MLHRLRSAFSLFDDTRQQSKVLHRLDEVLVCSFCAFLCDADSFTDMEDFAATRVSPQLNCLGYAASSLSSMAHPRMTSSAMSS
ncbi:MAG: transposase family protein [Prosthecobacter sp.]|uniref:transposase family protein n=1 Tax=Prosthecobacter sp. TaxID=1965333 RepID=UPI003903BC7A